MNSVEAIPIVLIFVAAVAITVNNFITTTNGYVYLIEARKSLLEGALATKPLRPQPHATDREVISPYRFCSKTNSFAYLASGYVGIAVPRNIAGTTAYLLIPSPSYYTRSLDDGALKRLQCVSLYRGPVSAFYIMPDGMVMSKP